MPRVVVLVSPHVARVTLASLIKNVLSVISGIHLSAPYRQLPALPSAEGEPFRRRDVQLQHRDV